MQKKLTRNKSDEEAQIFRQHFLEARPFRDDMIKVLEDELESIYSSMHVDGANLVDLVGQAKATKRVINMLKPNKEK